jgi:hypothetical protein
MKAVLALLLLVVVVLGALLYGEMNTNREQRDQIQKLTASLDDKSKQQNLALQEKCSLQAAKLFRELGYNLNTTGVSGRV